MADQHFVLMASNWADAPLQQEVLTVDARQQKVTLERNAQIGLAVAVDVAGDDGVSAAERLAQLALRTGKILNANEVEIVVHAALLGIDTGTVDMVTALDEIGDQVAL